MKEEKKEEAREQNWFEELESGTKNLENEIYTQDFQKYAHEIIRSGFDGVPTSTEFIDSIGELRPKICKIFVKDKVPVGLSFGAVYYWLLVEYEIFREDDKKSKEKKNDRSDGRTNEPSGISAKKEIKKDVMK